MFLIWYFGSLISYYNIRYWRKTKYVITYHKQWFFLEGLITFLNNRYILFQDHMYKMINCIRQCVYIFVQVELKVHIATWINEWIRPYIFLMAVRYLTRMNDSFSTLTNKRWKCSLAYSEVDTLIPQGIIKRALAGTFSKPCNKRISFHQ